MFQQLPSINSQVNVKQHLNVWIVCGFFFLPLCWISILATAASTISNRFWFCAKTRAALKWFAHYRLGPPDFDRFNSKLLAKLIPCVWWVFCNIHTSHSAGTQSGRNMGKTVCPTSKALLRTPVCVLLHFRFLNLRFLLSPMHVVFHLSPKTLNYRKQLSSWAHEFTKYITTSNLSK